MRSALIRSLSAIAFRIGFCATFVFLHGCGGGNDVSIYDQVKAQKQAAGEELKLMGATLTEKTYPQGKAWNVDLSGATIDGDIIENLQTLGRITELNLSGSTISDEQFAEIATRQTLGYLLVLDISNTELTDKGLAEAHELGGIYHLKAKDSKVTAAGIEAFRKSRRAKHPLGFKLKIEH